MPDLSFRIESAEAVRHAAAPLLTFRLHIENAVAAHSIVNVVVRTQIQIEAMKRRYTPGEQAQLEDVFGARERWGESAQRLVWSHVVVMVPAFDTSTVVELPVSCSYDFNVAAARYFHALGNGEVPLVFQFSGSVFYRTPTAPLQVSPISWSAEAQYRMPVAVWKQAMDYHYPDSAPVLLGRPVFERLHAYRRRHGFEDWEQALSALLDAAEIETA